MMAMHYEPDGRRLRIRGACCTDDRDAVREMLDRSAHRADEHLIVDLTAVTDLDPWTASDLVAAAHRLRGAGRTIVLVRKHGTSVDDALRAAEHACVSAGRAS